MFAGPPCALPSCCYNFKSYTTQARSSVGNTRYAIIFCFIVVDSSWNRDLVCGNLYELPWRQSHFESPRNSHGFMTLCTINGGVFLSLFLTIWPYSPNGDPLFASRETPHTPIHHTVRSVDGAITRNYSPRLVKCRGQVAGLPREAHFFRSSLPMRANGDADNSIAHPRSRWLE